MKIEDGFNLAHTPHLFDMVLLNSKEKGKLWFLLIFIFAFAALVVAFGSKSEEPLRFMAIAFWLISLITAFFIVRAWLNRDIQESKTVEQARLSLICIGPMFLFSLGAILAALFGEIENTKKINWAFIVLMIFLLVQMVFVSLVPGIGLGPIM